MDYDLYTGCSDIRASGPNMFPGLWGFTIVRFGGHRNCPDFKKETCDEGRS